jgi:hypothetical protein
MHETKPAATSARVAALMWGTPLPSRAIVTSAPSPAISICPSKGAWERDNQSIPPPIAITNKGVTMRMSLISPLTMRIIGLCPSPEHAELTLRNVSAGQA